MEILIACVGKAGGRVEAVLTEQYLRRLPVAARIVEIDVRGRHDTARRLKREGEKLCAALPDDAFVVALDEAGVETTSRGFAEMLTRWQEMSTRLAFVIGGADGLESAVRERADFSLALSKMTWPHLLVRAMLAEQLYRAFSIGRGHPYHRD